MGLRPFGRGVNGGYAPHRRFGGAAALRAQEFKDKELEAKMALRAAARAKTAEEVRKAAQEETA